jgi:iron complex outermembrane recepter protein
MNTPFANVLIGALLGSAFSLLPVSGQTTSTAATPSSPDQESPVVLSPFEITTDRDTEYRASHAASSNRFNTSLFDTPQSVTVLTEAFLNDLQAVDIVQEVLSFIPGVAQLDYGAGGEGSVSIRGQPVPSTLLDNMPHSNPNLRPDRALIERVEVIKGSSSSLYGSSWPGGVVNYISKKPKAKAANSLQTQAGSFGFFRSTLDMTGPLTKDKKLQFRLVAAYEEADSFRDHVNSDRKVYYPSLRYVFNPGTQLTVSHEYIHSRQTSDPHLPIFTGDTEVRLPPERFLGLLDRDFDIHKRESRLNFDHRLHAQWALRLNYSYSTYFADKDTGQLTGSANATTRRQARRVNRQYIDGYGEHIFQSDLLGSFNVGPISNQALFGFDLQYSDRLLRTDAQNLTPNFVDLDNPTYNYALAGNLMTLNANGSEVYSYGAYFQNQASVMDKRLQFILGYRIDGMTQESTSLTLTNPVEYSPPNAITPRYAVLFRPIPQVTLYATYGESFRFETSGRPVFGTEKRLDPITGVLTEVGAKTRFFDGKLSVDLEVYELSREGIVIADPNNTGFVLQTGLEETKGYAISFSTAPVSGLTLFGGYGYTDARVVSAQNAIEVGRRMRGVPKNSYSIFANYRVQDGPFQRLGIGAGLRWMDERPGNTNTTLSFDGYSLVNANVSYSWERYAATVSVNNVMDKFYWANVAAFNGNRAGSPREVRASLRIRF